MLCKLDFNLESMYYYLVPKHYGMHVFVYGIPAGMAIFSYGCSIQVFSLEGEKGERDMK